MKKTNFLAFCALFLLSFVDSFAQPTFRTPVNTAGATFNYLNGNSTNGVFEIDAGNTSHGGGSIYLFSNTFAFEEGRKGEVDINNGARFKSGGGLTLGNVELPSGYLLGVKGKVICEELKIKLNSAGWPDYVFAKEYALKPLSEVETFIKRNNHLPGIPSAAEVEKEGGIAVGELNAKFLQKIEELTLYMIELKKDNELLKRDNEKLKTDIISIKKAIK